MNEDTLNLLWIGAFRYWLGRQTISVHSFCDEIIDGWENIPRQSKGVILRDLKEAVDSDNRDRRRGREVKTLGHDMDRAKWLQVLAAIS